MLSKILFSTLRVSTPLILAGMAGLLSQQVNLLNIALEGFMLLGAFVAVVVGAQLNSVWLGLLAAIAFTVLLSGIFALFVIDLRAHLIVAGLAVNILVLGLTAFLLVILFGARGSYSPEGLISLPNIAIPLLDQVPFIGEVLSGHSALVYFSWTSIMVVYLLLYRTPLGAHIRAVGEHAEAAVTAGIPVKQVRYIALLLGGALCGMAGAQLSIGNLNLFTDNMTSGRGFIALAAVFFGGARPVLTALGCLLFGFFEAIQFRLQTKTGMPSQLWQMLPYLIVIFVLALISLRKKRLHV
ncbi:MAG: ABC transporter permease [Anaerolineales bacterium]